MDHRKLLEQAIDAQLNPLAEKIARRCNQEVAEVIKAIEPFKQTAIDQLLEARTKSGGILGEDNAIAIISNAFNEYLSQPFANSQD